MQNNDIVHIIDEYLKAKSEHESKRLYNLNIIDELHANENAHTRILLKLLSYENNGKKIVLEKFINIINEHINNPEMKIIFSDKSKIFGQFYFIDGYIKSPDAWAIIIENKINWADDQQNQIDRYIETAIADGIAENKIYVVYLTDNGTKKVSAESFTKEGNVLAYVDADEHGRFIELNYQDDILPLLEKTLSQLSYDKETILVSAIRQYIDYLEGRFGIRKNEKEYNTAMDESLLKILNLTGSNAEKYEYIESLQQELWQRLDTLKYEVYPNQPYFIARQLKDYLNQNLDKVSPFEGFGLYQGLCVFSRAWSLPLSSEKNKFFSVAIGIDSENDFSLTIHAVNERQCYIDDANIFQECLKEYKALFDYLENNKEFSNYENCYTKKGTFDGIADLQEKIVKQFYEIGKRLF